MPGNLGAFGQPMLLHRMAQLVVTEPQRFGGLALVVTVPGKRLLKDRALVGIDCAAQVGDAVE